MNGPVLRSARRPAQPARVLAVTAASAALALSGCALLPRDQPRAPEPTGPASRSASAALPTDVPSQASAPADPATGPVGSRTDFSAPAPPPTSTTQRSATPRTDPAPPPPGALEWSSKQRTGHQGSLSWEVTIPVFTGPAAAEINRRIRASAEDRISLAKLQTRNDGGDQRTLEGDSTVTQNDGRTVQVAIVFANYLAGTAHPDNWVNTTVVRTTSGRPVTLDQVFRDERTAYRRLAPVIRRLAKTQRQPVTESDGLGPRRENWAAWQTTSAGMVFHFQDYQLGGRGLRSYTIPWSDVRPLMSTSARNLLAPQR